MISIIISACLVSDPNVCKDHRVPVDAAYDPTSCAMYAPPHTAQWAEQHPDWRIVRWRCQAGTADDI